MPEFPVEIKKEYEERAHQIFIKDYHIAENGHIVLSGGNHTKIYIPHEKLSARPNALEKLTSYLAEILFFEFPTTRVIIAPESAQAMAYSIALHMNWRRRPFLYEEEILLSYARKHEMPDHKIGFEFKSSLKNDIKDDILIFDDIFTQGTNMLALAASVEQHLQSVNDTNSRIIGYSCIWNRAEYFTKSINGIKLTALIDKKFKDWPEEECPMCKEKGPASVNLQYGHGREFLKRKGLI